VFLVVGLLSLSQSGNLIRIGAAPPAAIAFWRLLIAGLVLLPLAGLAGWRQLTRLGWGDRVLLVLAAAGLTGHLLAWISAVQLTKVANASLFFGINPVMTVIAAHLLFHERVSGRLLLSIGLGLAGIVVIGLEDLDLSPTHLLGDAYAVLCAALFTTYFLLSKRLRTRLDSAAYVGALYLLAAVFALAALMLQGFPIADYGARDWTCFGLVAMVPTLIGHTSLNHAVGYVEASWLSVATLSEPGLAGLVAWLAWGEAVTPSMLAGYALIAGSVIVLARSTPGRQ
jgi:drug/metabolite transporter (DMT)-like permease